MSTYSHHVTKYVLDQNADHDGTAMITCYNEGAYVGRLRFFPPTPTTTNAKSGKDTSININYPVSSFNDVITTFREENPIYIWFDSSSGKAGLRTTKEPVGEEEGQ